MKRRLLLALLAAVGSAAALLFPAPLAGEGLDPGRHVTRFELAVVVAHLLDADAVSKSDSAQVAFSDVPAGMMASVRRCAQAKVLEGHGGKFFGHRYVKRYDFAVVLCRLCDALGLNRIGEVENVPADVPRPHWALLAVARIEPYDLIPAIEGRFDGRRRLDRALLVHALACIANEIHLSDRGGAAHDFDDVPPGHPIYRKAMRCRRLGFYPLPLAQGAFDQGK